MTLTAKALAEFCIAQTEKKSAYMWGEFGRKITNSTISQKAAQYPSRYTAVRQKTLKNCVGKDYIGCDCVGLYKYFLWTDGGTKSAISYKSATDRSTSGMYNAAVKRGTIDTLPEVPGIVLYMSGHVGVYIGNGEAVECTLGKYGDGIVKTKVEGRGWTHWLQMPEIDYSNTETPKAEAPKTETVTSGNTPSNTTKPAATPATSEYITMTVQPSVGLWLQNSDKAWNSSTRILCMPKGARVQAFKDSEKRLGNYTCVKVMYGSRAGFCAKEFLK